MQNQLKTGLIVLAIASMFLAGYAFAVLTTETELPTSANIVTDVNLSVYGNETTTTQLIAIDWGTMLPTQTETFDIWIQNDAEIPMTISISTQDWVPSYANESIFFSYAEGEGWSIGTYPTLYKHQRASIVLTLTAGDNPPSGAFSFTIVITGTCR